MKILAFAFASLMTAGVFAGHHDHKDWEKKFDAMSFEDAKKMMTEKMEMKSAMIEKGKTCVNDAKDKDALKKCKQGMMAEHHAMKDEMKEKMKKKQ